MKTGKELKNRNSHFLELDLLPYAKKVNTKDHMIWDPTRRKWLEQTPEEMVRQGLIRYFYEEWGFDYSKMRAEYQIEFNNLKKRLDLILYDHGGNPLLLAECKSWKVKLDHKALKQLGAYNSVIKSPFILACNGNWALLAKVDHKTATSEVMDNWPDLKMVNT